MAYDEGMAELLREALSDVPSLTEKKMFGGLCFMVQGNMLCGVHKGGGMFRVGAQGFERALAVEGTRPMDFTGRPMTGFVEIGYEALGDDEARASLLDLAQSFVATLPPKR
ncbi:MAG: TfoX/Sxy family protein [Rhodobacteraceae bacterium]|nr:TfoX/Sxy family protein [Paracoccaceae bacterium]